MFFTYKQNVATVVGVEPTGQKVSDRLFSRQGAAATQHHRHGGEGGTRTLTPALTGDTISSRVPYQLDTPLQI